METITDDSIKSNTLNITEISTDSTEEDENLGDEFYIQEFNQKHFIIAEIILTSIHIMCHEAGIQDRNTPFLILFAVMLSHLCYADIKAEDRRNQRITLEEDAQLEQ